MRIQHKLLSFLTVIACALLAHGSVLADFAKSLPVEGLPDPDGRIHHDSLKGHPLVIIFSIPDWTHGSEQQKWSDILSSKLPRSTGLVLIEDMKQTMFRSMAESSIKKDFQPGQRPLLLEDYKGIARRLLGIPKNVTAVLIYDKHGRLVDGVLGGPTQEIVARVMRAANYAAQ